MFSNLRAALDQAICASIISIRGPRVRIKRTYFPFADGAGDLQEAMRKRCKKVPAEIKTLVKGFKPYKGGDHTLWPLHRLDILRKHERLLSTSPDVKGFLMIGRHMHVGGTKAIKRLQNKTVLLNLSPGEILNATQGNTLLATFITFREPTLGLDDEEVATVLRKFAGRVSEIVKLFTPDKRSPEIP